MLRPLTELIREGETQKLRAELCFLSESGPGRYRGCALGGAVLAAQRQQEFYEKTHLDGRPHDSVVAEILGLELATVHKIGIEYFNKDMQALYALTDGVMVDTAEAA